MVPYVDDPQLRSYLQSVEERLGRIGRHSAVDNTAMMTGVAGVAQRQQQFQRPLLFKNGNGSAVPPYSIMAVTGMVGLAGDPIVAVNQPSNAFYQAYLVNGANSVGAGCIGVAQPGPIVKFAFDTGGPTLGDLWGPKSSQWTASKSSGPCILAPTGTFTESSANTYALGWMSAPASRIIYGTVSGTLTAGGSVSCSASTCLNMPGASPSGTLTVYDEIYGNFTATTGDQFCAIENFSTGHWSFLGIIC